MRSRTSTIVGLAMAASLVVLSRPGSQGIPPGQALVSCASGIGSAGRRYLNVAVRRGQEAVAPLVACELRFEAGETTPSQRQTCVDAALSTAIDRFARIETARDVARNDVAAACSTIALEDLVATHQAIGFGPVAEACEHSVEDLDELTSCILDGIAGAAGGVLGAAQPRACSVLEASDLLDRLPWLRCYG